MANPFPFVANTVLTAAQLNGIGEITTFTPTLSGITLGNGTKNGYYVQVNKSVFFHVTVAFGSTTLLTGSVDLTLPVVPASVNTFSGMNIQTYFFDNSATAIYFGGVINISINNIRCGAFLASGTYVQFADLSATVPFTWATSDKLEIFGTYEIV